MDLKRREFAAITGVSLSAVLAGCADAEEGGDDSGSETDGADDSEGEAEDSAADEAEDGGSDDSEAAETESDDAGDGDDDSEDPAEDDAADQDSSEDDEEPADSESGEANESDEDDGDDEAVYEDEAIDGAVVLSEAAERHLEVERHTFTWAEAPPSELCQVHAMFANASGAELAVSMTARVFDADGNELSSTTKAATEGPEPGADDAVYSFELNNCAETAAYELEVTEVEATGEAEEVEEAPERHLLRVLVQDGFGEPIEDATVSAEERGLGGWGETRTVDDHGQAEFEFQAGDYLVTVEAEGYPTLEESLELTGNVEYTATLRAGD
ncbi:carboxypeptidase regulatory-like domain-containing protein [Natronococcus sp. A-GB7]|uniref:carboxypeptidase-like regulatory domain-containing protein n=1 Tax=Natronococcus sp. A-GB7 TaxID=3037649 RepID=UPI00241C8047|nr:carboxypeptidase regulatory-like domain-containing protein [Natronococcus sp. A-GB7]MDG5818643.1 carboxypeptidase regulatory-like domain-containing protein [Natronococcus sp. A-GB7]